MAPFIVGYFQIGLIVGRLVPINVNFNDLCPKVNFFAIMRLINYFIIAIKAMGSGYQNPFKCCATNQYTPVVQLFSKVGPVIS